MDATFSSTAARNNIPISKRRRFAPVPQTYQYPSSDTSAVEDCHIDSPLLLQFSGRKPTQQEIETELLQVGMRIRKSVNDGYKISAFTPRPFFNMNRLSPETQAALCATTTNRQPTSTATFCGISLAALAHIKSTPIEEPKIWKYSTSHKRGYEGDSDSDDQEFMPQTPTLMGDDEAMAIPVDYFDINFDGVGYIDPMAQMEDPSPPQVAGRRLAIPKSRRPVNPAVPQQTAFNAFSQLQLPSQLNGTQWMGHKRMTSCGIEANMSINDFGEASFLQRREDVDMDCS